MGMTEDEMIRWHHRLNGMSLSKLQELMMFRKLERCHPQGHKEVDMTE